MQNQSYNQNIENSDLDPIRADEEQTGGIIHKAMYERLMLCEYAVADLSLLNANVFYELGIRHAIRPYSTITLFESSSRLPFDVNFLRSLPYDRKLDNLEELKSYLQEIKNNLTGNYYIDSSLEGNIPKFSYKLKEGWSDLKIGEILFENEGIKSLLKSEKNI